MGGNTSSQQNIDGEFKITTHKNLFFPGEQVNLKIYIKTSKTLKTGNLTFQIKQQEFWQGSKTTGLLRNKKEADQDQNTNILYNNQFQFQALINNSNISKGIEIPFTIQLPNYMLPSLEFNIFERFASIRTHLTVKINELGVETFAFLVINKPPSPLNSPLKLSVPLANKVLGIFGSKHGVIEASYPSNNFSFYTNIPLSIHIDKGKESVNSITTKLVRKIRFLHGGKEESDLLVKDNLIAIESPINSDICDINLNVQVIEPESVINKYINNINGVQVPDKKQLIYLVPSIETNLIKVEYYIKITPNMDALINLKKSELILPLSISHRSINDNNLSVPTQMMSMFDQGINQINTNANMMNPMQNEIPDYQTAMGIPNNPNYNQPPNQNYNQPPNQNYNQPPNQNYNQPPNQNFNPNYNQNYNQPQNQNFNPNYNQNYNLPQNQNFNPNYNQNYNQPQNPNVNPNDNQNVNPNNNQNVNPNDNQNNPSNEVQNNQGTVNPDGTFNYPSF
jgi:hypothetical protein